MASWAAALKIEKSMRQCADFLDLVDASRVPRSEPFTGVIAGRLAVLGPTRQYYRELLAEFSKIEGVFVENERLDDDDSVVKLTESERNPDAVIDEDDTTSAENNSSVIGLLVYDGKKLLFTGDAGVRPWNGHSRLPTFATSTGWMSLITAASTTSTPVFSTD